MNTEKGDAQLNQLLSEFRSFRDNDFREFRDQVVEMRQQDRDNITELEVKTKDIYGNGTPGRMTKAEDRIDKLDNYKWWLVGVCAGVSGVASVLAVILFK